MIIINDPYCFHCKGEIKRKDFHKSKTTVVTIVLEEKCPICNNPFHWTYSEDASKDIKYFTIPDKKK